MVIRKLPDGREIREMWMGSKQMNSGSLWAHENNKEKKKE